MTSIGLVTPSSCSGNGRFFQLRDLVFHYFDSYRGNSIVWIRIAICRADCELGRLAAGQCAGLMHRGIDGGIGFAYPTAGGLYFWAYRLGGRRWAWTTAWFNMIGQVTTTAGVNIGVAIYVMGAITRMWKLPADAPFRFLAHWITGILCVCDGADHDSADADQHPRYSDYSPAERYQCLVAHCWCGSDRCGADLFWQDPSSLAYAFQVVTTTNPYDFSSAEISKGVTAPALYLGNPITQKALLVLPSPLFRLFPALTQLYHAAPLWLLLGIGLLQAQWTYTDSMPPRTWRKKPAWHG